MSILKLDTSIDANKWFNLGVGVTGSVSAIKLIDVFSEVDRYLCGQINDVNSPQIEKKIPYVTNIRCFVVLTASANHFIDEETIRSGFKKFKRIELADIYQDKDEWSTNLNNREVLHIQMREKLDSIVVIPCSAHTLAKLANGLCDNLLTCVLRAWDFSKPLLLFPTMNTRMWEHPFTQEHLKKLRSIGYRISLPEEGRLFCGDVGMGRLPMPRDCALDILTLICDKP